VFPMRYELGFCIPEDCTLHSHRRENLKSYKYSSVRTPKADAVTLDSLLQSHPLHAGFLFGRFCPEDRSGTFLRNGCSHRDYTALYLRKCKHIYELKNGVFWDVT
jgi:hypothetical protein